jgi:hypothetical protein
MFFIVNIFTRHLRLIGTRFGIFYHSSLCPGREKGLNYYAVYIYMWHIKYRIQKINCLTAKTLEIFVIHWIYHYTEFKK